jgi:DNA-binding transcriptional regulator YiaG
MTRKKAPVSARSSKRKSAGSEIIEGLREFRDAIRAGEKIDGRFTVRTVRIDPKPLMPGEYNPAAVRSTREKLLVSQAVFAQLLGISVKLVQAWEQGTRTPDTLARHVLDAINATPGAWRERLERATQPRRYRNRVA